LRFAPLSACATGRIPFIYSTVRRVAYYIECPSALGYIRPLSRQKLHMPTDPQSLKSFLLDRKSEIAASHRAGADGFTTCIALTLANDEAIRSACDRLPAGMMDTIAILALGGYGRGELSPHSDIDIMILCSSGDLLDRAREAAKALLHFLWDSGTDIGHSVRTIGETLSLHGSTFDSWASVIESRFICGNHSLAGELYRDMRARIAEAPPGWFVEGVLEDVRARHERYGSSVKLLEPNIKKSAGGLRDLHAAFWLHCGTDPRYFTSPEPGTCATRSFLDKLHADGTLEEDDKTAAVRAFEFLLRVRHEMHYRRESQHDTLEYALQREVAEGIGVAPGPGLMGVEVFMGVYYRHARTVYKLLQRVGQRFRESIEPPRSSGSSGARVGSAFMLFDDALGIDPAVKALTAPAQIFEAFALSAQHGVPPDLRLRGLIERSADLLQPSDAGSPQLASFFRRILGSGRVAETLHEMNDVDVLPRYIPEFGALVAFFQHNVYHYYTADEHTLIAIASAEKLADRQGLLGDVFRSIPRRDLLYAALFLHDIAKPQGVADHEITGVSMSAAILDRLGMQDVLADVGFLVRNHLVMEQIAFRRNIHDPDTLKEFASRFERPELLDYLYVLTYADLSALNVNVWTEWKAAVLGELYQRTAEVLRRKLTGAEIDRLHREKTNEAAERVVEVLRASIPPETVRRHIAGIDSASYVSLFTEEEIGQHIIRGVDSEPVSALFSRAGGHTEVTVIARDAPFALSKFCAVLSANDADIFDANVFTRDDGLIIDRFRVIDAATKKGLEESRWRKIEGDLRLVMQGVLDIDHLFREHDKKWKRRPKRPVNPLVKTDVCFEENPRYTIIDVYAPDSAGFLYRVTETMSELGLDIYFAKIATRVDGIVDAFYVLDRAGRQITDPAVMEEIRGQILATIQRLARERLDRLS
jgi:[protein-PII] uridylyltransferase